MVSIPGHLALQNDEDFVADPEKPLGEGGTALVFFGSLKSKNVIQRAKTTNVAIKFMSNGTLESFVWQKGDTPNFRYEIALMASLTLRTEFVVKLIGYCLNPAAIIMPIYQAALYDFIGRQPEPLSPLVCSKIAFHVISAIKEMHEFGIIHHDIKPRKMTIWL